MVKVIKEGTRKITTCEKCGCEFSYEEEDVEKTYEPSVFGSPTTTRKINCPQCKSEIVLLETR